TGISGAVSSSNSLVGSQANDQVGVDLVTALSNGNFVVRSSSWNNGSNASAGAVTWGNGSTGISGAVSSSNSLVGSQAGDQVGGNGITALSNGNFVVSSSSWINGGNANAGAVTWGNGSTGISGVVSSSNSLVGSQTNDQVGEHGVTALSNGNYVVRSSNWNNGSNASAGAVTWGNGSTGTSGVVSSSNSLVGSQADDYVGGNGINELSNGNYLVRTTSWDSGSNANAGAVTWGSGSAGVSGVVSSINSLVGSQTGDRVGSSGITALSNGNYVVTSVLWDSGSFADAGAVTWGNGSTGISGVVSSGNSLVGSQADDRVGGNDIKELSNGNYVVRSAHWTNGSNAWAGAVTLGNGSTGISGAVSSSNSLVGSQANDRVGSGRVIALIDGRALVGSPIWSNSRGRVDILSFAAGSDSFSNGHNYALTPGTDSKLLASDLTALLNAGTNVTLQANSDISVSTAISANNPGGNGGALALHAGRSILINANINTDNGNLTLIANDTTAHGVLDAHRDSGNALITMGAGSSIDAGSGAVSVRLLDGAGKTHTASGDITLRTISAASIEAINTGPTAGSGITLASGSLTASTGSGDGIVLAGKDFTNNAGASALSTPGGARWLVWSGDASADTRGGLSYDFKQYNASQASSTVLGSGNGFLYTLAPTLSASLTGSVNKVYDGNTTATLSASHFSFSGAVEGDSVSLNGGGLSASFDNRNAGAGKTVTATGISFSASQGSAAVYGYTLTSSSTSGAIGSINQAHISAITGITAANKVYDGTTAATLNSGGAAFTGKIGSDVLSVATASGAFANKTAANGKTVSITGLSLGGDDAGNYVLDSNTASTTANIDKAHISTITGITAANKV
ncbi:beta strand repeat-containing protein, partial [Roseateles sp.]|uniref:beta strand repeat-containing protein n=1 Tax=Roseateles sp. TaxID=1971397 RepID=UPI003BA4BF1A